MRPLAMVAVALVVLAGCGASPDPAAPTTASASVARSSPAVAPLPTEPGPDTVALHLDVSNQSLAIPQVRLVIELDGRVIIDDVFAVEGQHTYVRHDLHLDARSHEIVVTATDHDADRHETFDLEGELWALIAFWLGEEDATDPFSWSLGDEEPGNA